MSNEQRIDPRTARDRLWTVLEELVPLKYAGSWDNVGRLLDPYCIDRPQKIFLTIDLTEAVYSEAVEWGATEIVAYHPPIFGGLKRLTYDTDQGRVLLRAAQDGIGIYSPHSALDAIKEGMCDWLASPFFSSDSTPIEPASDDPKVGAGRIITLTHPLTLHECLSRLQSILKLSYMRVASGISDRESATISKIALCPGSGGSLFNPLRGPQLFVTGEMQHHDVLHRVREGNAVILTEHTRCERGYLPIFAKMIKAHVECPVKISNVDEDPLNIWIP